MRNVYLDKQGCGDRAFYVLENPHAGQWLLTSDLRKLDGVSKFAADEPVTCGSCGRLMEAHLDPQLVYPEAITTAENKILDERHVEQFKPTDDIKTVDQIKAEREAKADKVGEKIEKREEEAHEKAAEAMAEQNQDAKEQEPPKFDEGVVLDEDYMKDRQVEKPDDGRIGEDYADRGGVEPEKTEEKPATEKPVKKPFSFMNGTKEESK